MKKNIFDSSEGIFGQIGNTPLVRLSHLTENHHLFGKLEHLNPGGSIKDRTAKGILRQAIQDGKINQDTTVVESTSGNMGIGLAISCQAIGLPFIAVVDPYVNRENIRLMKLYGAHVIEVTEKDEHGSYLNTRIRTVEKLLEKDPNSFWTAQYSNMANPKTHHQTMEEIVTQLGRWPDYLFIATSTCGTLAGMAEFVKLNFGGTKIIAVDAFGSLIFSDKAATRRIPGFGAARKSQFLNLENIHRSMLIKEEDSISGAYELLRKEAILAGGSTGAVVSAYLQMADEIPDKSDVVLMVNDRGERYMESIYCEDWLVENYGKEFQQSLQKP